ncbi:hypothetical protein VTN00DRAFT_8819 [Thermoascus crustaceus]|uniref:uncharacterized protein n=1 Tax=Thermoascus crustaceus TaxID=5088 RepID=UPI0037423E95
MPNTSSKSKGKAPARKKACKQCTQAKARCGHERPRCSRCLSRNLDCQYLTPADESPNNFSRGAQSAQLLEFKRQMTPGFGTPPLSLNSPSDQGAASVNNVFLDSTPAAYVLTTSNTRHNRPLEVVPSLDFSDLDLVSITDSAQIRNRWLESFLPSEDQVPKAFQPYTVQFLTCVLGTYPKYMLRHGGIPPIIHPLQIGGQQLPVPLANCYSLVRMWETRARGSEAIVTATVQREMERLLEERESYGQMDLLSAFQAYLIYGLMAYFSPDVDISLVDHSTMVHLQEFACQLSATGLVSAAELSHTRPKWESWIVASAKRRALLTAYIFNNVFNTLNDIPVYLAKELTELPVPSSKLLWEAPDRAAWEREYDRHLSLWEDGELRICELWRSPETGSPARRERIDRWLRSVDEFGMMLFATCAHLHGC